MGEASRFRARAAQCRLLAKGARDFESRRVLSDMATELEDEAAKIEVDEAAGSNDP